MIKAAQNKPLEQTIGQHLKRHRLTLSIAESITGGMLSDRITNIPGSSNYFMMSVVAYSNEAKINLLKVPKDIIKKHGAVSKETAKFMVKGMRKKANTDISLSITGIAGPSGGIAKKPVGLVYIGLASADKKTLVKEYHFKGSRIEIKKKATDSALKLLSDFLENARK